MTAPLKVLTALATVVLVAARATDSKPLRRVDPPSQRYCHSTCSVAVQNGFSIPLRIGFYEQGRLHDIGMVKAGATARLNVPVARAHTVVIVGTTGTSRVVTRVVSLQPGRAAGVELGLIPHDF